MKMAQKTVRCGNCQELNNFDIGAGAEPNAWGLCEKCGAQIGLDPQSTYYKCICGRGQLGVSAGDIGDGTWATCSICSQEFALIPHSSKLRVFSCPRCKSQTWRDLAPGDFRCECGKLLHATLAMAHNDIEVTCASCDRTWNGLSITWRLECGCGFIDVNNELQNRYGMSSPGKSALTGANAIPTPSPKGQSRVDKWLNKAFIAADPVSMVVNFVAESVEIGMEGVSESQQRRKTINPRDLDPKFDWQNAFLREPPKEILEKFIADLAQHQIPVNLPTLGQDLHRIRTAEILKESNRQQAEKLIPHLDPNDVARLRAMEFSDSDRIMQLVMNAVRWHFADYFDFG